MAGVLEAHELVCTVMEKPRFGEVFDLNQQVWFLQGQTLVAVPWSNGVTPDRQTPDLCNQAKPMKPFLFYHVQTDSNSTFESVAFPSWFITSSKRGQPIFLTSDLGRMYSTAFRMNLRI
ncbi:hypothetical protein J1605_005637 [Eschrichtius robustus]|uniref:Interleukin-1 n=1 Tax=Eschrichtius robustus TaxID=9764 RepID=A0AB34H8S9_ESCRO|nr:hypothetical protein J1605_005637 [Eschrichtius robustus]